jgi:DNA (cytosine-5)-methyltransferase 1
MLPRAVLLETAKDIFDPKFAADRAVTLEHLDGLGYRTWWEIIDASQFGVPQRRLRAVLIALRESAAAAAFAWPEPSPEPPPTVGDTLLGLMAAGGWPGAVAWAAGAQDVAPTVVRGSKKHGGADLSGSQGKAAWRKLGIDPMGIAEEAPGPDGKYLRGYRRRVAQIRDVAENGPMLTVPMTAQLQGFPAGWQLPEAR